MRNANEIKEEMGIEDPLVNTSVHVQRLLIEVLLDVRDLLIEVTHERQEKPLCTAICADPDLIRVVDGHGYDMENETERERVKGWARIKSCKLRERYKCKFGGEELKCTQ